MLPGHAIHVEGVVDPKTSSPMMGYNGLSTPKLPLLNPHTKFTIHNQTLVDIQRLR